MLRVCVDEIIDTTFSFVFGWLSEDKFEMVEKH